MSTTDVEAAFAVVVCFESEVGCFLLSTAAAVAVDIDRGVEQLLTVRQRRPRWMRKPSGQELCWCWSEEEKEVVRMRKARS